MSLLFRFAKRDERGVIHVSQRFVPVTTIEFRSGQLFVNGGVVAIGRCGDRGWTLDVVEFSALAGLTNQEVLDFNEQHYTELTVRALSERSE